MQLAYKQDTPGLDDKLVIVRVGQGETKDILVYENLIRKSSKFMDNALRDPWPETQERVIDLPTINASAFKMYYLWLLSGKVHSKSWEMNEKRGLRSKLSLLRHALYLGHYFRDTDFVDALSDALIQVVLLEHKFVEFPHEFAHASYSETPKGSPVRPFVMELLNYVMDPNRASFSLKSIARVIQFSLSRSFWR